MKQALKKKEVVKKPSISDIRASIGYKNVTAQDLKMSSADKPLDFIAMPPAFQEAVQLPGFPMGYMSIITGWSNTGKSTIKNCLIASCINNGILPVIYETENNFDWSYAIDCGVKATPVYGLVEVEKIDQETGEVYIEEEEQIIDYSGDFIYYDTKLLAEQYGSYDYAAAKQVKTKRKIAVIEDIAQSMNDILDAQERGDIQQPICFIWDSVGSIPSFASVSRKLANNMYDAGAISQAFNIICNSRIPSSRKVDAPYSNTFVCVNKIWNDSMNSMGGAPSIELKGGKSLFYSSRLILHLGGMAKSAVKKLSATVKGETVQYATQSKIKVTKNQLPSPHNLTYEGEFVCTHNGLWRVDDMDEYKKDYLRPIIENKLKDLEKFKNQDVHIDMNEVEFVEEMSDNE